MATNSQNESNLILAQKAFDAWQMGENTGNYNDFKLLLKSDFNNFSHPLLGIFAGNAARIKLLELIAERELKNNQLEFTEIELINTENQYAFLFNSSGTISGKYVYRGFNAIILTVAKQKLTGFREYFGIIDSTCFQ